MGAANASSSNEVGVMFLECRLAKMLPGWVRRGCFENPEPVSHRTRMERGGGEFPPKLGREKAELVPNSKTYSLIALESSGDCGTVIVKRVSTPELEDAVMVPP